MRDWLPLSTWGEGEYAMGLVFFGCEIASAMGGFLVS
jgi:hypothetical protein